MAVTAQRVLDILKTHGTDGVFRVYAHKTYDPAGGSVSLGQATNHTCRIIPPFKPGHADQERWGNVDGIVHAEALTGLSASGLTFTPAVGMELTHGDRTWVITGVSPIRSQSDVLMYELALKAKGG